LIARRPTGLASRRLGWHSGHGLGWFPDSSLTWFVKGPSNTSALDADKLVLDHGLVVAAAKRCGFLLAGSGTHAVAPHS
jgi:hypothetical protein